MLVNQVCTAVAAIMAFTVEVAAGVPSTLSQVEVLETRRQQPASNRNIPRDLQELFATEIRRQEIQNITNITATMDLSWNNADLFSFGNVTVSCVTCYIKGRFQGTLNIAPDFDVSTALKTIAEETADDVANITNVVFDTFGDWVVNVTEELPGDVVENIKNEPSCLIPGNDAECSSFDWDAYPFPKLDIDFDAGVDLTSIPDVNISMVFDAFELYLELDMTLDASQRYEIALYPEEPNPTLQPVGFTILGQQIGVLLKAHLILAFDASVSISTGVHVQFDDGLTIELPLFSTDVADINLSPGKFEFLPVTVSTTGFTMDAILRLGVQVGVNVNSTSAEASTVSADVLKVLEKFQIGAGVNFEAYADIAHFKTNITPSDTSIVLGGRDDTNYPDDCALPIIETYEFGLGANAGAWVAVLDQKWGPTPNISTPLFYTTLFSACALSHSATSTASTATATTSSASEAKRTEPARLPGRRDDAAGGLTMSTVTSLFTFTNRGCISTELGANCPASLQNTTQSTKTSVFSSMVAEGQELTFPATTAATVSPKAFGAGLQSVPSASGPPSSWVPPTTASSSAGGAAASSSGGVAGAVGGAVDAAEDKYNGLSEKDKKLVIGLTAGLGGALAVGLVALATFCIRRRKEESRDVLEPFLGSGPTMVKGPEVHERELLDQPTGYDSGEPGGAR